LQKKADKDDHADKPLDQDMAALSQWIHDKSLLPRKTKIVPGETAKSSIPRESLPELYGASNREIGRVHRA
jgi:hypothetical protein